MPRMATRRLLTELSLEKLRPPKAGRAEIADKLAPGLVIRVTERGVKSWSVIYKVPGERGVSATGRPLKGRQHRVTLGRYPATSLTAARREARDVVDIAQRGEDPAPRRREAIVARHANSVEAVAERMIKLAKKQIDSWPKMEQTLRDHVLPKLGARPISDITRANVHELLDELVADERHGTAREVRKHLSRLFNYAAEKELIAANPIAQMKRRDLRREVPERALNDVELRVVWWAAGEIGYPFGPAIRLLMLTGQRKSEWGEARRSEIETADRLLAIPRERYKGERAHIVPLADAAWQVVEALPTWRGNDYHLFSTTGGKTAVAGWSRAKSRLDREALKALREVTKEPKAKLEAFDIHDLRRTCETRLARLGFNKEVRDAVLGHAKEGLQRTYNKYDYLEEKRAALAAYARHVMEVVG